ncbi:MAG: YfhO family protein [Prolixibacteraceae bacterium]
MAKIKGNRNIVVISGIILFYIVFTLAYFSPLLKGERLTSTDSKTFLGSSKEVIDFREDTGHEAFWTNSIFSGMPAYLISTVHGGELLTHVRAFIVKLIPSPAGLIIINFIFFFILGLILGIPPLLSAVGGLMYGLSTYFFVLIGAGHVSKVQTLAFVALCVGGVLMAFQGKAVKGSIITALGLTWLIGANHPQMAYYAALMVIIIGITYFIFAIKEKTLPAFLKATGLLVLAVILAIGANFGKLYTTYDYGKYSTRGKSDLTPKDADQTAGLDKSYILDYSYDFGEAMTAFIPRFKGGGMAEPLGENSSFYQELVKSQGKERASDIAQHAPLYWGSQPISSAPFYYGAILCFLFVFGLFMVRGKEKWWIAATVIVSLLLSLGKNIPGLAHFMIEYFPGYNKFRDVKNIIVIQQFAMALLGVLAIKEVYLRNIDDSVFFKRLKWALGITGGIALLFAIFPGLAGNFIGQSDAQLAQSGWPQKLIAALQADRRDVLRADAFRSFLFVTMAAGVIWLFWTKKIKAQYALALWAILVLVDMWPIDKRYLNNDDFVPKRKAEVPYIASTADTEILKDKSLDYRVLNMAINPWSDASTSYFHKSIGGYHGAKLRRYQDMIEHHLSPELRDIQIKSQNAKTIGDFDAILADLDALNMLNTKYIIYNPNAGPLLNTHAFGNAWFVNNYHLVANADEEIAAIDQVDVRSIAIIDQQFKDELPAQMSIDSTARIALTAYAPNKMVYSSSSSNRQLAVFSEIYYPKGWTATIDGLEQPILRANYILRALLIPEGQHEIIFEFKPKSYEIGNKISFASSIILLLAIVGIIFGEFRKRKNTLNVE